MPTITKKVPMLKCSDCGHEWIQRGANKPVKCPRCQNFQWDEPKASQSKAAD